MVLAFPSFSMSLYKFGGVHPIRRENGSSSKINKLSILSVIPLLILFASSPWSMIIVPSWSAITFPFLPF
jgi:hypothetical protein